MARFISALLLLLLVSGCGTFLERLQTIGHEPPLKGQKAPSYPPEISYDKKARAANSLWDPTYVNFFRSKTRAVGDIIRINVEFEDEAKLANESSRQRKTKESLLLPKLFGLQDRVFDAFSDPASKDPSNLLGLQGDNSNLGKGAIDRSEKIRVQIAAMVSKILPNGSLWIEGTQEIRVNYEVRAVSIRGIVRSEDINIDNTVDASKIAELRVSYGGRGHISDFQQPRYGSQLLDIISPF